MFKRWTSHYVNLFACGTYVSLLFVGQISGFFSGRIFAHETIDLTLAVLIIITLLAFAFNYWRYLAISKAPVSSIAAAAQGYVELNGITSIKKTMYSPLHNVKCVWYRSWTYAKGAENLWRLIDYQQSDDIFQLADNTGTCTVDPRGAEVIHMTKRTRERNYHRYVEEYLLADFPLYLIGQLDTRHHFADEKETTEQIGLLITDWKSNPVKMKHRFDLDRNGEIDQEEWEKARAQAHEEVKRQQVNRAHTGDFEIAAPKNGQLYLLSGIPPQDLRKRYGYWTLTYLIVLCCLFVLMQLF